MKDGVIYLNSGTKCLVRLLVSIHSLRKYYDGPVAIVSVGEESHASSERLLVLCVSRGMVPSGSCPSRNVGLFEKYPSRVQLGTFLQRSTAHENI